MKIKKFFYPNWTRMCLYDHTSSIKPISRGLNTSMAKPIPNVISVVEKKIAPLDHSSEKLN